jgi:transposase-like protein
VILLAVRWYLRYGLSDRDLEELLAERDIEVDHVTLFRWVQRFTPILVDAAKPCRHSLGASWSVDETYVKVSGSWRYVYRAVDQYSQVIDVFVLKSRDLKAASTFFTNAIRSHGEPAEVTTDRAHALARAIAELLPAGSETGPDRQRRDPRARLHPEPAARPLRARDRCTSRLTLAAAFDELAQVI